MLKKLLFFFVSLSPRERIALTVLVAALIFSAGGSAGVVVRLIGETVPAPGGSIREGFVGFPRTFSPLFAQEPIDRAIGELVFDGLMRRTGSGKVERELAETVTISADGREVTVRIKEGVMFSDGAPLTSEDVAATVSFFQSEPLSVFSAAFRGVVTTVLDERSVKFTLPGPNYEWIDALTFKVLPKHVYGKVPPQQWTYPLRELLVGSGPFTLDHIETDAGGGIVEMSFLRNDRYAPLPYIDKISLRFYASEEIALEDLARGILTSVSGISREAAARAAPRFNVSRASRAWAYALIVNFRRYPRNLTKQLVESINWDLLSAALGPESGQILRGEPLPRAARRALGIDITPDERQRMEMSARVATTTLSVSVANESEALRIAGALKDQLAGKGIFLTIVPQDTAEMKESALSSGEFDALLLGVDFGLPPDFSQFFSTGGRLNLSGFSSAAVDAQIGKYRGAKDENAWREGLQNTYRQIAFETPAVFLVSPFERLASRTNVHFTEFLIVNSPADRFSDAEAWYTQQTVRLP